METIKIQARTDEDGHLHLDIPTSLQAQDVEVVLVLNPTKTPSTDALGWPEGFFERTYGALADDPIERPPQLPLSERDEIE